MFVLDGIRAQDVEELIVWHENFDSRDYTKSSQRHAATLKHGQKEIKSIVGSVLLSQLRTNYQNHLAQVRDVKCKNVFRLNHEAVFLAQLGNLYDLRATANTL